MNLRLIKIFGSKVLTNALYRIEHSYLKRNDLMPNVYSVESSFTKGYRVGLKAK